METVTNTLVSAQDSTSWWFYVSVLLFIYILFLKYVNKLKPKNSKLQEVKNKDINMDDLMTNINGSRDLYKNMSRKYHPDRFIGDINHSKVEELFKEISKNKRNVQKLNEIKIELEQLKK